MPKRVGERAVTNRRRIRATTGPQCLCIERRQGKTPHLRSSRIQLQFSCWHFSWVRWLS